MAPSFMIFTLLSKRFCQSVTISRGPSSYSAKILSEFLTALSLTAAILGANCLCGNWSEASAQALQPPPPRNCIICERTKVRCVDDVGIDCPGHPPDSFCYVPDLPDNEARKCTIYAPKAACNLLGILDGDFKTPDLPKLDCSKIVKDRLAIPELPPALPGDEQEGGGPPPLHKLLDSCCLFNHERFHATDKQFCSGPLEPPCAEMRAFDDQLNNCLKPAIGAATEQDVVQPASNNFVIQPALPSADIKNLCLVYVYQYNDKLINTCLCNEGKSWGEFKPGSCTECRDACASNPPKPIDLPPACRDDEFMKLPEFKFPPGYRDRLSYCEDLIKRRYPICFQPGVPPDEGEGGDFSVMYQLSRMIQLEPIGSNYECVINATPVPAADWPDTENPL